MIVQNAGPNGASHHTEPSEPQHSHCTSSSLHSLPATRGHNLSLVITATSLTSYINSHCHLTQLRTQSCRLQPQRAMFLSPYSASVLGRAASQIQRELYASTVFVCPVFPRFSGTALLFHYGSQASPVRPSGNNSIKVLMSMQQWCNGTDRGKLKYWERNII